MRGEAVGVWSLCSAHPAVDREARCAKRGARRARCSWRRPRTRSTSSAATPACGPGTSVRFLHGIAARAGFAADRIWIGGDHLGPNAWQGEPAESAMDEGRRAGRASTSTAGFRKIHLDCSMACGGDPTPLPEELVAARAARLCSRCGRRVARSWRRGARLRDRHRSADARRRDRGPRRARGDDAAGGRGDDRCAPRTRSHAAGSSAAWPRVIALVVQPGRRVRPSQGRSTTRPCEARALSAFIAAQSAVRLRGAFDRLPDRGRPQARSCAIISRSSRSGPARRSRCARRCGRLPRSSRRVAVARCGAGSAQARRSATMLADPRHWRGHYHGEGRSTRVRPAVQLERPHPLLLAAIPEVQARCRHHVLSRLRPASHSADAAEPVPAAPARCRARRAASPQFDRGDAARGRRARHCARTSRPAADRRGPPHERKRYSRAWQRAELESRGAAWTAREIAQQPEVWPPVGEARRPQSARRRSAFLQPLARRSLPARRADGRRNVGLHRRLPRARIVRTAAPPSRGDRDHRSRERARTCACQLQRPDAARLVRAFRQQPRERRGRRAGRAARSTAGSPPRRSPAMRTARSPRAREDCAMLARAAAARGDATTAASR